ncbi:MAG: DUF3380 domain-containing protein [Candidatus Kapabacteria bacterium]|nr:DUF3380 domain-containing protein [Candidatus Kapabacteria bacterium]
MLTSRETKLQALKDGDWANFARVYNGTDYKKIITY